MAALHQDLRDLGRDLPEPLTPIAEDDISLTPEIVKAARKERDENQE